MVNCFIEKIQEIQGIGFVGSDAPLFDPTSESIFHGGRQYQLIKREESECSVWERAALIISCVWRTLFCGCMNPEHTLKEDWTSVFTGRQMKSIYLVEEALRFDVPEELSSLNKVIGTLKNGDQAERKKASLLKLALYRFLKNNCSVKLETHRLSDLDAFKLTYDEGSTPDYFKTKLNAGKLYLDVTPSFYDYKETGDGRSEHFWVDFANASLGGGCFTHGFVQEEVMVHEMPDFANHIAKNLSSSKGNWCDISTRLGDLKDRNRVGKGVPDPYLLKGVTRVQAVDNGAAYGCKINGLSENKLLASTKALKSPQKVNLLAIAAPQLFGNGREEQWNFETLADNFNTLIAGFILVQEQSKNPVIHSGKIGCGAFKNDIHAIYLLHCLAAQHMGLRLKLHGYSKKESTEFQKSWETVAPTLKGKTIEKAIKAISNHLQQNYQ